MADRESNKAGNPENEQIGEAQPNPHGEQTVAEMPIETDHRSATSENVAQTTSTIENHMNPSVTGDFEDPSSDSMFNNADPQTRELLKKDSARERTPKQTRGHRRPKTA